MSSEQPPLAAMDLEHFTGLGRLGSVALSPEGSWVAAAVSRPDARTGRYRSALWRLPVDGGAPACLVQAEHHARSPAFTADGRLLFLGEQVLEDEEGEPCQDQVLCLEGGQLRALTDAPRGVRDFRLAAEGDRLAWTEDHRLELPEDQQRQAWLREQRHGPGARHFTRQPARYWKRWLGREAPRLRVARSDGSQARTVAGRSARELIEVDWTLSRDGRWLALTRKRPAEDRLQDSELWLLDLELGEEQLLDATDQVTWTGLCLDATGGYLAATRHQRRLGRRGPEQLWLLDLRGGDARHLAADWDRWPEPVAWHGGELLCTTREDAGQPLYAVHAGTGRVRLLLRAGVIEGRQLQADRLLIVQHDLAHPPAPAVVQLDAPALARLPVPGGQPDLAPCTVQRHATALPDGQAVPYLVLRPTQVPADQPLPTLFWVHGGPVSHWADWWHWRWNAALFASYGYAIVMPNPRGSTGYGQAWIEGIWNNRWGEQCVDDLLAVLDDLSGQPGLDLDRLAAMGASFGGWMVNRLGGLVGRWSCVVSHAGIFDDRAFAGSTDMPPYWHWEHAGTPWDDPAHDRWSPHHVVSGWTAPTLVIHGEKDYRVPLTQALALFEALLHHGVDAELLAFPDEGHWIERPPNVLAWHQQVLAFLARHLDSTPPRPAGPTDPSADQDW